MAEVASEPAEHSARFDVHHPLLALFAEGIGGLRFQLQRHQDTQLAARTDGNVIVLPGEVSRYPTLRENLGFYRLAILHQVGFFEFGTFLFRFPEALRRMPEIAEQGGSGTVASATHFEHFFAAFKQPALIRRLFNLIEDARIDACIARRYPGALDDLRRAQDDALEQALMNASALPGALRAALLSPSQAAILGFPAAFVKRIESVADPAATVYESALTALHAYALAPPPESATAALLPEDFEDDGHEGILEPELVQRRLRHDAIEELLESTEPLMEEDESDMASFSLAPENLDDIEIRPGDVEDGVRVTLEGARQDLEQLMREDPELDLNRRLEADRSALRVGFGEVTRNARTFYYDEWDYLAGRYRPRWCRLFEERVAGDDSSFMSDLLTRHGRSLREIRRRFEALRAMTMERQRRLVDGDDIDLDEAIARHVDLKARQTPSERVYSQRHPRVRDVAAAFLLDVSASTDTPIEKLQPNWADYDDDDFLHDPWSFEDPGDQEAPRTVLDVQKEALALMATALGTIGDAWAVYGFSGYGHDEVEFYVAHDFGDPPGPRAFRGIAGMKPRRSTRMGPAIRHAVHRLNRQDSALRLLIILSDGFPQDHDYGPDRTDHTYGIRDTARALDEARQSGVETFCITVDKAGHDYLREMCPSQRYLVLDEIEALPDELLKIYETLGAG